MSNCPPQSTFIQAVNQLAARAEQNHAQDVANRDKSTSLQQGGMQELILNLAVLQALTNQSQRYESSGRWVYLSKSGTTPGTEFTIEFAGGRSFTKVVPGTYIKGDFRGMNITNTGAVLGAARFVIGQSPDVDYNEENIEGFGNPTPSVSVGAYQTYNAAAFGVNIPTGVVTTNVTAISLAGKSAVRAIMQCLSAAHVVTGTPTLRWWFADPNLNALNPTGYPNANLWVPGPNVESLTIGAAGGCVSSDLPFGVRSGYALPEVIGCQTSNGSGSVYVGVEAL